MYNAKKPHRHNIKSFVVMIYIKQPKTQNCFSDVGGNVDKPQKPQFLAAEKQYRLKGFFLLHNFKKAV